MLSPGTRVGAYRVVEHVEATGTMAEVYRAHSEAEEAKESADRVAALVQMVPLMEKLTRQLSPWHVRHKEAIATGIAVVGSLAGVASVVSGFLR